MVSEFAAATFALTGDDERTIRLFGVEIDVSDWDPRERESRRRSLRRSGSMLFPNFSDASFVMTSKGPVPAPAPGSIPSEGERTVNFFGEDIVFPDWHPKVEREIRKRAARLHLTESGKAEAARSMIVQYLERYDLNNVCFRNGHEALRATGALGWKVARARGIVCER